MAIFGLPDQLLRGVLVIMRLAMFALAFGLTFISFQAYRTQPSDRLESAFIGFAFLSMGVAVSTVAAQFDVLPLILRIVETVPFIIGFGMLYLSLYR